MRILVLGSGAREHALLWKLSLSPRAHELYVSPGNAGMAKLAQLLPADGPYSKVKYAAMAEAHSIDLTVVGPENLLAEGIVDHFRDQGLRIFGPTAAAARLEGSKVWAKEIMQRVGIPTAGWRAFEDYAEARARAEHFGWSCVIKADGLAAGKGSFVCHAESDVDAALKALERTRSTSSSVILVEELLEGQEVSVFAISDGRTVIPFGAAQDHKRLLDHDQGPNTGGMGAYSPVNHMQVAQGFADSFFQPLVRSLRALDTPYTGVLYAGAIVTSEGPKILEFNCRFGDPEAEVLLRRLDSDLADILYAATDETLHTLPEPAWNPREALCVVAAAGEYPEHGAFGSVITGLDTAETVPEVVVFHAGTERDPQTGRLATNGGRILCVTAVADSLKEAQARAYKALDAISFAGIQYRTDIGSKALPGAFDTQWRKSPRWEKQMRLVTEGLDSVATALQRLQLSEASSVETATELGSIRRKLYTLKLQAMLPDEDADKNSEIALSWEMFAGEAERAVSADRAPSQMAGGTSDEDSPDYLRIAVIPLGASGMRFEQHRAYDMLVWRSNLSAAEALPWLESQRDSSGGFFVDTDEFSYSFDSMDVDISATLGGSLGSVISIRLETDRFTCLWSIGRPVDGDEAPSFAILAPVLALKDVWWFVKGTSDEQDSSRFGRVLGELKRPVGAS